MRDRPERVVKKAVHGTHSLHAVKCVRPGVIQSRLLACFCDGCISGTDECANTTYVSPWKTEHLKMAHDPSGWNEPSDDMEPQDQSLNNGDIQIFDKLVVMGSENQGNDGASLADLFKSLQGN